MKLTCVIIMLIFGCVQPTLGQINHLDGVYTQFMLGGSKEGIYLDFDLGVEKGIMSFSTAYSIVAEPVIFGKGESVRSVSLLAGLTPTSKGLSIQVGPSYNWVVENVPVENGSCLICLGKYELQKSIGTMLRLGLDFLDEGMLGLGLDMNFNKHQSFVALGLRAGLNVWKTSKAQIGEGI